MCGHSEQSGILKRLYRLGHTGHCFMSLLTYSSHSGKNTAILFVHTSVFYIFLGSLERHLKEYLDALYDYL